VVKSRPQISTDFHEAICPRRVRHSSDGGIPCAGMPSMRARLAPVSTLPELVCLDTFYIGTSKASANLADYGVRRGHGLQVHSSLMNIVLHD
jgi:hypothetical protein